MLEGLGPSSQQKKAEGKEEEDNGEEKGNDDKKKYLALLGSGDFNSGFSSLYIKFFAHGAVSSAGTLKGGSLPSPPASSLLTRGLFFSLC